MNKGLVTAAFAFVLISVSIGTPQFEIREGNCKNLLDADRVMSKQVHYTAIPLFIREDKVRLTCSILT